jgi:DNA-binding transcriptional ArsR family regulator
VALDSAGRFEWERIVRRASLQPTEKLVALLLATYADPDGTRVKPGTERLMRVSGLSKSTIIRALTALRDAELLDRVEERFRNGRKGGCDVYRLTRPSRFDAIGMLDPDEERVSLVTLDSFPGHPQPGVTHDTRSGKNECHPDPERVSPDAGTGVTHDTPPDQYQPNYQPHDTPVINSNVEGSPEPPDQDPHLGNGRLPIERQALAAINQQEH